MEYHGIYQTWYSVSANKGETKGKILGRCRLLSTPPAVGRTSVLKYARRDGVT
jgi:hypothetical protein